MEDLDDAVKYIFLLGNPVKHSISPQIQNIALKYENLPYVYKILEVDKHVLKNTLNELKKKNCIGFNVTIPFKTEILQYLDEIKPIAMEIGSVNTVKNIDGRLVGNNTDIDGIVHALAHSNYRITRNQNIVVIGAGGAARSVIYHFSKHNVIISILNRTTKRAEQLYQFLGTKSHSIAEISFHPLSTTESQHILKNSDLIINCTPLGMWPKIEQDPIPEYIPSPHQWIFDLVYNPPETQLVKKARQAGCKVISGLDVLVFQAVEAFKWWTGVVPDANLMKKEAVRSLNSIFSKLW